MDVNRPEHYYRAALERIKQAHYLYREGSSYSLAMYVAGVAVECLLRAFRARKNPEFESRHDLLSLFAESGMLKVAQEKLRAGGWSAEEIASHVKTMRAAVNDVYILWHNNYRYASENRVLTDSKAEANPGGGISAPCQNQPQRRGRHCWGRYLGALPEHGHHGSSESVARALRGAWAQP